MRGGGSRTLYVFREGLAGCTVLLVLAGVAVLVWLRVLAHADSLANRNRDSLIATLAKTE